MSAEIVSLQAWRCRHCAHHEPETRSVSVPCLLPTWPYGWLQPMLVEIDVGMIVEFGVLAARVAGQTDIGGLTYRDISPRPARDRRQSAAIIDFFGRRLPRVRPPATCEPDRKRIR